MNRVDGRPIIFKEILLSTVFVFFCGLTDYKIWHNHSNLNVPLRKGEGEWEPEKEGNECIYYLPAVLEFGMMGE